MGTAGDAMKDGDGPCAERRVNEPRAEHLPGPPGRVGPVSRAPGQGDESLQISNRTARTNAVTSESLEDSSDSSLDVTEIRVSRNCLVTY